MAKGTFKGLSIQVLDDNPYYARLLEHELKKLIANQFGEDRSVEVSSYTDYREYLDALPAGESISFVDFYLGDGVTGLDLLDAIRERSGYCRVVIMTGGDNLHVVRSCIGSGAGGVVFKDGATVENCQPLIRHALDNLNNSNFR